MVDKKGKGALRVLDALTLDTDTLDRRFVAPVRPSTRKGTAQPSHCRPVILLAMSVPYTAAIRSAPVFKMNTLYSNGIDCGGAQ